MIYQFIVSDWQATRNRNRIRANNKYKISVLRPRASSKYLEDRLLIAKILTHVHHLSCHSARPRQWRQAGIRMHQRMRYIHSGLHAIV